MSSYEVTTIVTGGPLDLAIASWLHSKRQSLRTMNAYAATLAQFRAALQYKGLDLNTLSNVQREAYQWMSERQIITLTAQEFASWSVKPEKQVAPATQKQRLSVISSFYVYAIKHDFLDYNPIEKVERAKVHQYDKVRALTTEQTSEGLGHIDQETPIGKRDYAILSVLLSTGRRVSEVAGLRWQHVEVSKSEIVTLRFTNLKGGKEQSDILDTNTGKALLVWLRSYYGGALTLTSDSPLWISLASGGYRGRSYGGMLSVRSFTDICERHFGTTRVHRTRHTWTKNMLDAGAPLPLIQQKLAHASLATTGIYASVLASADNPYREEVARRAGIK
jgi:site-specific recombinase XerD